MFGAQQDPSRTEKATPKRVSKQRDEGNVPKSPELGKAVSLLGGVAIMYAWIGPMTDDIKRLFRHFLAHAWEFDPNPENVYSLSIDLTIEICRMIMPILLTLAFLAFTAQRLQVGKLWSTKILHPKFERFNLVQGLKQMLLSPQTALRTIKSLLFSLVLGIIPGWVIYKEYQNFLPMYYASTEGVATYMLHMAFKLVCYALMPIMAIAVFDVWQSRFAYNEGMKMTKSEVKDEQKQVDGDPVVKGATAQKDDGSHEQAHVGRRTQGRRGGYQPYPHRRGAQLQFVRGPSADSPGQGCGPYGRKNQGSRPRAPCAHPRKRASGTGFV